MNIKLANKYAELQNRTLIVASGGGFTQIENALGALSALDEVGYLDGGNQFIDGRGTSAGAVILSCLAALKWDTKELTRLIRVSRAKGPVITRKWFWPFRMFFGDRCIYDRTAFKNLLKDILNNEEFFNIRVIATEYPEMKRVEMAGSYPSVLASTSIQRIFSKVEIDGNLYLDGGYTDNVPVLPWAIDYYKRVFIILPPKDPDEGKEESTFIGKLLSGFDTKLSQEVNEAERIYSHSEVYPNCLVIRPSPYKNNLLGWSDNLGLLEHAYKETLKLLVKVKENAKLREPLFGN